mmetsp:Transcript_21741/g.50461  ORF Transcript_21741/g.50461 Transcript_21741/m.50461 type:complete len:243 (-) Transcript_21741:2019-2747(-)
MRAMFYIRRPSTLHPSRDGNMRMRHGLRGPPPCSTPHPAGRHVRRVREGGVQAPGRRGELYPLPQRDVLKRHGSRRLLPLPSPCAVCRRQLVPRGLPLRAGFHAGSRQHHPGAARDVPSVRQGSVQGGARAVALPKLLGGVVRRRGGDDELHTVPPALHGPKRLSRIRRLQVSARVHRQQLVRVRGVSGSLLQERRVLRAVHKVPAKLKQHGKREHHVRVQRGVYARLFVSCSRLQALYGAV